jgi:D-3-phosphoglycerate dehydrogenase
MSASIAIPTFKASVPARLGAPRSAWSITTALPTEMAKQCKGLKHVVFLGTGARSYMNPDETR